MEEQSVSNTPDKKEILKQLREAKSAQIEWWDHTRRISATHADTHTRIPLVEARSRFGRWYHDSGRKLTVLKSFNQVTRSQQRLQRVSTQFFSRAYPREIPRPQARWFQFRSEERLRMENQIQLNKELEALKSKLNLATSELISSITVLEREIQKMPSGALRTLYTTTNVDMEFEASLMIN